MIKTLRWIVTLVLPVLLLAGEMTPIPARICDIVFSPLGSVFICTDGTIETISAKGGNF